MGLLLTKIFVALMFPRKILISLPFIKRLLSEGAINIEHKAVKITKEITPGLIRTYICLKKLTNERINNPKLLE